MSSGCRVGLIFGGSSVEHEVSIVSARGVAAALDRTPHSCVPIAVTDTGRWLPPDVSRRILDGDHPRVEPPADGSATRVAIEPGANRPLRIEGQQVVPIEIDLVFPLVHGWGGEDGRLQGLLDLAGIPCAGPGLLGSALAMDKDVAKILLRNAGLPVVPWIALTKSATEARDAQQRRIMGEVGLPAFVKPANGGSSVGVSRVGRPEELAPALERAFACDRRVLVERAVPAPREIECAVLGNDGVQASILGEIVPSREFYDYAAKYLDGTSRLTIPAPLPPGDAARLRELALVAYRALDLAGFARVDFLVERSTGAPFVNEINTLPGFTPISMFPKLWEASGLAFPALIERIVALALERASAERQRQTRWGGT